MPKMRLFYMSMYNSKLGFSICRANSVKFRKSLLLFEQKKAGFTINLENEAYVSIRIDKWTVPIFIDSQQKVRESPIQCYKIQSGAHLFLNKKTVGPHVN